MTYVVASDGDESLIVAEPLAEQEDEEAGEPSGET